MPLLEGKSKHSLKKNIETEMEAHPGRRDQNLAIAFSVQRKAKEKARMEHKAHGGMAHDHKHDPRTCMECTGGKRAEGGVVEPMKEDMGRNMAHGGRAMRAIRMARGGVAMHEDAEELEAGDDAALAMKDTYPQMDHEESDRMASEQGFGNEPMHNEMGDEDQDEAREEARRTRMSRALEGIRKRHMGK